MATTQLDPEKNRVLVFPSNPDDMNVLLKLPSRRWLAKARKFVVPITRMNAEQLYTAWESGRIELRSLNQATRTWEDDKETVCALVQALKPVETGREWPGWFTAKLPPSKQQQEALYKVFPRDNFALLMRMGTGKSKVFIDACSAHFYMRNIQAVILFCPMSVKSVWMGKGGELDKHSPCPYLVVDVDSGMEWADIPVTQDRLTWLICGIESLSQGNTFNRLEPFAKHWKVAALVDESSRIKNHKTIRTQRITSIGRHAVIRGIGTGTPATRNLMDLYSQFEFLDTNIVGAGDYYAFRNRYALMGGFKNKKIVGYDNVDELMGLIEPYVYRCDKPEGMVGQFWAERTIKLHDEQRTMYRMLKKGEVTGVNVKNVLNRVAKLQEVVGGFLREDPTITIDPLTGREKKTRGKIIWALDPEKNPKIRALHEYIEELGDESLIVWAKYRWELDQIAEALAQHGHTAQLHGDVPEDERVALRQRFQEREVQYMAANQQVGGIGHTFTAAHLAIYYSNTHSLEDRLQSEDRIHRRGQESACFYTDLIAENTVDDGILVPSIVEKKDLDQYVRDKLDAAKDKARALEQLLGDG
jgi:hypothetical protein